jgi:hypothetical protein
MAKFTHKGQVEEPTEELTIEDSAKPKKGMSERF